MYLVLRDDDILVDRYDNNGYNNREILGVYSSLEDARKRVLDNIYKMGLLQCHFRNEYFESKLTDEIFYYRSDEYYRLIPKCHLQQYFTPEDSNVRIVLRWEFEGWGVYDDHHISFEILECEIDTAIFF